MALTNQRESAVHIADQQLPFFPLYQFQLQDHNVFLWLFETDFSQSAYGKHSEKSSACTLIALLNASAIIRHTIRVRLW